MPRYFVHAPSRGVPALSGNESALTPPMVRTYAGWSSRGKIHGSPGTEPIPVADPAATREDVNSMATMGTFSTLYAPNVIFPPLYWEADSPADKEKFPASVFSDDQMPVPAARPSNVIVAKPYVSRKGGQRQVTQPQVVQKWRGLRGTPSG
jgi:hypothetical protein